MLRRMGGRRIYIGKPFVIIVIIISLIIIPIYLVENNLKPTIKAVAESRANLIATQAINEVIYNEVLENVKYNDLVEVHKDMDNKITLIQANTIKISRLIADTNIRIKEALESLSEESIEIPLGQALGSYLFAAHGPKINIKILPVGEINVKLAQDFSEAGINQTRHIIYMDINTSIRVVVPMATDKITVATQAPVAETIIVGSVPNTVLRLDGFNNLLKGSLPGQ
ncbi:MAG: sporulation protein YunB [Bacillota bacterium]